MKWSYHRILVVGAAALVLLSLQALPVVLAVMLDGLLLPFPWLRRRLLPLVLEELAVRLLPLERQVDRLSSQTSLRHVEVEAVSYRGQQGYYAWCSGGLATSGDLNCKSAQMAGPFGRLFRSRYFPRLNRAAVWIRTHSCDKNSPANLVRQQHLHRRMPKRTLGLRC
jgi:hypothetical protein